MPKLYLAEDGHYYTKAFVQPDLPPATYQIANDGADYLNFEGIFWDDEIPRHLFNRLKEFGMAYTNGSGLEPTYFDYYPDSGSSGGKRGFRLDEVIYALRYNSRKFNAETIYEVARIINEVFKWPDYTNNLLILEKSVEYGLQDNYKLLNVIYWLLKRWDFEVDTLFTALERLNYDSLLKSIGKNQDFAARFGDRFREVLPTKLMVSKKKPDSVQYDHILKLAAVCDSLWSHFSYTNSFVINPHREKWVSHILLITDFYASYDKILTIRYIKDLTYFFIFHHLYKGLKLTEAADFSYELIILWEKRLGSQAFEVLLDTYVYILKKGDFKAGEVKVNRNELCAVLLGKIAITNNAGIIRRAVSELFKTLPVPAALDLANNYIDFLKQSSNLELINSASKGVLENATDWSEIQKFPFRKLSYDCGERGPFIVRAVFEEAQGKKDFILMGEIYADYQQYSGRKDLQLIDNMQRVLKIK